MRMLSIISSRRLAWNSSAFFWRIFFFSSRRRHTRLTCDWSSDVCSSDLRGSSGATSFLVGLAVGAGVALLFAPQSGEETRRQLKRRARRAAHVARDAAGDLSDTVVDRYEQEIGRASCRERG